MKRNVYLAERVLSASKRTRISKASRLGIVVTAILLFLIFAVSYYGEVTGNFTFSVDREAQEAGISLYESAEDKHYTTRLFSAKVENADGMTHFCGTEHTLVPEGSDRCIPADDIVGSVDGANNGTSYLGYTFYVENVGDQAVDLNAAITIIDAYLNAEESLRVRVIIDDEATTYARRQSESGVDPGEAELFTEPFHSRDEVLNKTYPLFEPGEVKKVTLIIWYEGEDADHHDAIKGGGVKLEMDFSINKIYGLEDNGQ